MYSHVTKVESVSSTGFSRSTCSAGGVGIYVKSSISYNLKPTINIDLSSVENLWIEIEMNKKKLIVGVVYHHPVQTVEQIDLFSRALTNIFMNLIL